MGDFRTSYSITKKIEGGYANSKNDNGGETYKGIARKFWSEWSGWKIIDSYKKTYSNFEQMLEHDSNLQSAVLAFYKQNFWNELSLDSITDQAICDEMFDTGVNCATSVAAMFLQRALNVLNCNGKKYPDILVDGKIGPKTIQLVNNHPNPKALFKVLNVLQGAKYVAIAENNPTQEEFMLSWLSRVAF